MRIIKLCVAPALLVVTTLALCVWRSRPREGDLPEPCCAVARLRNAGYEVDEASLTRALSDSRSTVRAAALESIDKLGLSLSGNAARQLIADASPPVRERALIMLRLRQESGLGPCPTTSVDGAVLWQLAGCLDERPPGFKEPDSRILEEVPIETVRLAVEILCDRIMDGRAAQWWLQRAGRSVQDGDRGVVSCLRYSPSKTSIMILQRILRDASTSTETKSTAVWVANAILSGGDQDRTAELPKRIELITSISDEEARLRLRTLARNALNENGVFALDGMRNLGFCGSQDDVPLLAGFLDSSDGARSEYAALALWKLTGKYFAFCQMDNQSARHKIREAWCTAPVVAHGQ